MNTWVPRHVLGSRRPPARPRPVARRSRSVNNSRTPLQAVPGIDTLSWPHHCALHAADNNNIIPFRERASSTTVVHACTSYCYACLGKPLLRVFCATSLQVGQEAVTSNNGIQANCQRWLTDMAGRSRALQASVSIRAQPPGSPYAASQCRFPWPGGAR